MRKVKNNMDAVQHLLMRIGSVTSDNSLYFFGFLRLCESGRAHRAGK